MRRLGPNTTLVIATHNAGKLREIADLLTPHGLQLISAGQLGLPEPAEDAPDFVGNARLKARAAATVANLPALSDDSGFCVAALDGAPGVHSARFAGPDKNFTRAMADIHAQIKDAEDQRAWFICALCLAWPDGHTETFVGRVDGTIAWPPRGTVGFGYDPMFVPQGGSQTYGEMDPAEKHATSHRARAFAQIMRSCIG
jgi:XTP/dITP diphosphohydrolase